MLFQSTPLTRGETLFNIHGFHSLTFQSTPLTRGETQRQADGSKRKHIISIHSPHTRGDDHAADHAGHYSRHFNPLPSHEGRPATAFIPSRRRNFNPLPSHEGRPSCFPAISTRMNFNPLPSHEGRHGLASAAVWRLYFNPLPSHEGRQLTLQVYSHITLISIHSPHTRGDPMPARGRGRECISIHSPHTRGDYSNIKY